MFKKEKETMAFVANGSKFGRSDRRAKRAPLGSRAHHFSIML